MAFCMNCGHQLPDGAKFCSECGASAHQEENQGQRKIIFEGTVHKCPNCGEVLNSLKSSCPTCGCEIRGGKGPESVKAFAQSLHIAETEEQKVQLIRSFWIPNTKEDIFEFLIMASSGLGEEPQGVVADVWRIKIEECYQKATVLLGNDPDFAEIQRIYNQTTTHLQSVQSKLNFQTLFLRNVTVLAGVLVLIAAVIVDLSGFESVWLELVGLILLVASAVALCRRKSSFVEYCIGAASGIVAFVLALIPSRAVYFQMAGLVTLTIVVIGYFRSISKKSSKE